MLFCQKPFAHSAYTMFGSANLNNGYGVGLDGFTQWRVKGMKSYSLTATEWVVLTLATGTEIVVPNDIEIISFVDGFPLLVSPEAADNIGFAIKPGVSKFKPLFVEFSEKTLDELTATAFNGGDLPPETNERVKHYIKETVGIAPNIRSPLTLFQHGHAKRIVKYIIQYWGKGFSSLPFEVSPEQFTFLLIATGYPPIVKNGETIIYREEYAEFNAEQFPTIDVSDYIEAYEPTTNVYLWQNQVAFFLQNLIRNPDKLLKEETVVEYMVARHLSEFIYIPVIDKVKIEHSDIFARSLIPHRAPFLSVMYTCGVFLNAYDVLSRKPKQLYKEACLC